MVSSLLLSVVISVHYSLSLHVEAVRRLSWWRLTIPQYNRRTVLSGLRINLVKFVSRSLSHAKITSIVSANPLKDPIVYLLNF